GNRALITTLTKKMAEHLTEYYREVGVRVRYLHSDIHTLDRIDLIRGLREGMFDVLVGINLLREGLDLPEVALVGIMDADKEGFLRSETSLVQTIGRAARNVDGRVILYADKETDSIRRALRETERRRTLQARYNREHGITPRSVSRAPEAVMVSREALDEVPEAVRAVGVEAAELPRTAEETKALMRRLEQEMYAAAKTREFEKAAVLRDQLVVLEKYILSL
ncbi:MAG: UvrB/UvrC motif-containing protein, partial [Bdellovibrionales bacterium]|nr:UvrB/UvrC motif-containing protein [Bdellovibrionales bacterium]